MKARLITLMLLLLLMPNSAVHAQSDMVIKRFEIAAPDGYEPTYYVSWSPDGTLVALSFASENETYSLNWRRWQVYDVKTTELVNEFANLIAWSADSQRLVAQRASNVPPQIMDAHTGALLGTLKDAGSSFVYGDTDIVPSPFVMQGNVLPNLDRATDTLRCYRIDTGELLFTLHDALELPIYTRDLSRFAVNTANGVEIYDTANYTLIHTLKMFRVIPAGRLSWSLDDQRLVVTPNDYEYRLRPLYIWTPDRELSAPIYNNTGRMAWSPDSAVLAVPSDYTKIRLYDAESGELVETIRGFSAGPTHIKQWQRTYLVSISGDYRMTGFVLTVWDTEEHTFHFNDGIDLGYVYRVEGSILDIFEPFRDLRQINLNSGEMIREIRWEQPVHYLSPDWRWAISPDYSVEDGLPVPIHLYRMDPFELAATVEGDVDMRYAVWSPDSRYFASIGQSPNTVSVWEIVGE